MGKLIDEVAKIRKKEGKSLSENSTRWLIDKLQKPDDDVQPVSLSSMVPGKFYFMMYDLSKKAKSSKLEQYNPILFVDFKHVGNTKILFGLSFNFLPSRMRLIFFDKLLDNYPFVFEEPTDKHKKGQPEQPLNGVNYNNVYTWLTKIGYEYVIREFDLRLVDKVYEVSMSKLPLFLTINTYEFTNVDDEKLAQIWLAKLKTREERHQKLLLDIASGYDTIEKVLNEEFGSFQETMKNLKDSQDFLNNIAKNK
jgi:hypothetical protein